MNANRTQDVFTHCKPLRKAAYTSSSRSGWGVLVGGSFVEPVNILLPYKARFSWIKQGWGRGRQRDTEYGIISDKAFMIFPNMKIDKRKQTRRAGHTGSAHLLSRGKVSRLWHAWRVECCFVASTNQRTCPVIIQKRDIRDKNASIQLLPDCTWQGFAPVLLLSQILTRTEVTER